MKVHEASPNMGITVPLLNEKDIQPFSLADYVPSQAPLVSLEKPGLNINHTPSLPSNISIPQFNKNNVVELSIQRDQLMASDALPSNIKHRIKPETNEVDEKTNQVQEHLELILPSMNPVSDSFAKENKIHQDLSDIVMQSKQPLVAELIFQNTNINDLKDVPIENLLAPIVDTKQTTKLNSQALVNNINSQPIDLPKNTNELTNPAKEMLIANTMDDVFSHLNNQKKPIQDVNIVSEQNIKAVPTQELNALSKKVESRIAPEIIPSYDAAINNMATFINKNIMPSDGISSMPVRSNSDMGISKTSDSPISSLYSVGDAGASLKIEPYTAKIKIYPPDLGQVTAELVINNGTTELTLTAENSHVRAFMENHLPQLRETFLESNINLSQVTIQDNTAQNKQDFQRSPSQLGWTLEEHLIKEEESRQDQWVSRRSDSLIDTYA